MKKIWGWIVGAVLVVGLGIYIFVTGSNSNTPTVATTNPNDNSTTTDASGTMDMSSSSGSMPGMQMGQYKDGTYTGSVADAVYGQLQVVATISGGMITNITWPVYPNNPGHTSQVSATALPALEQEAIAAQSANVNIVSGATQDSEAFQQSLAAALAQAKS
jgi:uncharacterized protein with FMN-binding domain